MSERKIRVIKKAVPELKHNPDLGKIKLTKWAKVSPSDVVKTREKWLAEHEEQLEEDKRKFAGAEGDLG